MSHSHTNSVPVIVTTDHSELPNNDNDASPTTQGATLSPTTSQPTQGHARRPSDPNFLHPILRIPSADPSGNTAPSSPEGSINVPPSPTLSASSVHFQTSVALRGNDPDKSGGMGSLTVLGDKHGHSRKGSVASTGESTEGTEPDAHFSGARSDTTSITAAGSKSHSAKSSSVDKTAERKGTSDSDATKGKGSTVAGTEDTDPEAAERPARPDASQDHTDPTPYAFKPLQLASLVDPKNLELLRELGGADGLIKGLGTHRTRGLSEKALEGAPAGAHAPHHHHHDGKGKAADIEAGGTAPDSGGGGGGGDAGGPAFDAGMDVRKHIYGENVLPTRASKGLLLLMWLALKDKVLVLLSVAAVVSLALGLYQDIGAPHEVIKCPDDPSRDCSPPRLDFVEGVAIVVAIAIVVLVGSVNDWQKERQFRALNEKKEDRGVKVIRCGNEQVINIKDVVVGDIALVEPGEIIPCDGVFLRGHNVRCDESGATGESDAIRKAPYEEIIQEFEAGKLADHKDCFLISGGKVLEGVGEYLVIAVGQKSFNGRIMMALRGDSENTPLQLKLNDLAELIAKIGGLSGLILFTALMIKFFVQLATKPDRAPYVKANNFIQILVISVTLVVVAVPEGLPLAVTLALAFATKRMTKENLLVRVLGSCETMANASVVCTDKTGTLTSNVMTVVAGSVGVHSKFVRNLEENKARSNAHEKEGSSTARKHPDDFSIDQSDLNSVLSPAARDLFNQAIAINSTAFEDKNPETGELEFVGSKTETALLRFAKELGWEDYKRTREAAQVVQMIPFSSERKAMGVVVKLPNDTYRVYLKGASEILTKLCTHHIVVKDLRATAGTSSDSDKIETTRITEQAMDNISRTIIFYANQTLRTIAICYRDLPKWPPAGASFKQGEVAYEDLAREMTLIGITGIEDPLRPGVREAVAQCAKAGVTVKMCTGDNVLTARSIATQCGIYTAGGIIMEGPVFRTLNDSEMMEVVPRLQVLARSSPEDKKILVERLKSLGEIVGVTGDGTNDGPALKTANVGFSMGIAGTEVAKEASDIVLMDDNFASIVSAIIWGRCVNDAVRKFLQFQISVNITAVIITFVSAVASDEQKSVLTAVQLLWINIIMDTFAALALATDPAHISLLNRKPDRKTAPLFSIDMVKQIIGQSLFQIAVILILNYAGPSIFGLLNDGSQLATLQASELRTTVFNTFVFCQIFNSINSRRIDNHLNVFEGLLRNYYFIGITIAEIAVQVLIVFVGSYAFSVTPIGGRDWAISVVIGFLALPLGALLRLIPNGPLERLAIRLRLMKDPNALPTEAPEAEKDGWNSTVELVKDNLNTFARVRGGRMRSSSFVIKSRSARLHEAGVQLPSLLAVVPALIATSVGAAWTPQPGLHDPAHADPSRSSAALWEGKLQLHPETKEDDPAFKKWGAQIAPKENV